MSQKQYQLALLRRMTFSEWQTYAQSIHRKADRVRDLLLKRARQTCQEAGLDPDLLGIHPHNAMCGFNAGKPWPEVDYSLVRKTLWLIDRAHEPDRIASRIIRAAWNRLESEVNADLKAGSHV